jgi:hypothetical protein
MFCPAGTHAALRAFVAVFRAERGSFRACAAVFLALGAALAKEGGFVRNRASSNRAELPSQTWFQHSHAQAVILVSWNREGGSPQIRVITGNKQWDASFLETKASTTFNAGSGIASSLENNTIGVCGLSRFISIATS